MEYEFHPDAEAEFLESVGYYELRVQGLGDVFIAQVESVLSLICNEPALGVVVDGSEMRAIALLTFFTHKKTGLSRFFLTL